MAMEVTLEMGSEAGREIKGDCQYWASTPLSVEWPLLELGMGLVCRRGEWRQLAWTVIPFPVSLEDSNCSRKAQLA